MDYRPMGYYDHLVDVELVVSVWEEEEGENREKGSNNSKRELWLAFTWRDP